MAVHGPQKPSWSGAGVGGTLPFLLFPQAPFSSSLPRPPPLPGAHLWSVPSGGRELDVDPSTPYTQDWKQIQAQRRRQLRGRERSRHRWRPSQGKEKRMG